MRPEHDLDLLRHKLAEALCQAQAWPIPRTPYQTMLVRLLYDAFTALDPVRGVPPEVAASLAEVALRHVESFHPHLALAAPR